jgi:hypothetical protein
VSPRTDPVAFALGLVGLWCGASALLLGAWLALGAFYRRRARRLAARAAEERLAPIEWTWPSRP